MLFPLDFMGDNRMGELCEPKERMGELHEPHVWASYTSPGCSKLYGRAMRAQNKRLVELARTSKS